MHRLALAIALVATAAAGPAGADDPNGPNAEGEYTGAKPGVRPGANEGHPQKKPRAGTLSWIGFEAKEGGATVWLQAANSFELDQRVEGATLVVHISGLRRMVHNLSRYIDTRFFDNPLSRIKAKLVGSRRARKGRPGRRAGIEIRIQFKTAKDAKEASVRTNTEADGLYYAYLSFPPGTEPANEPDPGANP